MYFFEFSGNFYHQIFQEMFFLMIILAIIIWHYMSVEVLFVK